MASIVDDSKPTIIYWAGVKSRSFPIGVMLACTGNLDNVNLSGADSEGKALPYPGTPEWAALPPKTLSPWNVIPTLVDKESGTYIGESGAILRWLLKKLNLQPDDMKLYALSEQSIEVSKSLFMFIESGQYAPNRTEGMD